MSHERYIYSSDINKHRKLKLSMNYTHNYFTSNALIIQTSVINQDVCWGLCKVSTRPLKSILWVQMPTEQLIGLNHQAPQLP